MVSVTLLPPTASLELIVYLMGLLCACLRKYSINLEDASIIQENHLKTGFSLIKLVRHSENILGRMIASFYVILFGYCCAGMFYCTGILNVSAGGVFYPALLMFCLTVMIQALTAAILLSYMIRLV